MKYLLLLILLAPQWTNAASISISVKYREAANIFVIMDCVSGWWDQTYCTDEGEYQKYWTEHFGLTEADKKAFSAYNTLRKKYYKGLGLPKDYLDPNADGIFAKTSAITEDLLSPAFYSSVTLKEALTKAQKILTAEDFKFLTEFYQSYDSKYQTLLKESEAFNAKASSVNKRLQNKKYADFFTRIASYYSVSESMAYEVLFVWWPPLKRDSATPIDKFLVFQQNPITQIESQDDDIIFHEIVHTISARQSQKQKQAISEAFLKECPQAGEQFAPGRKGRILEEPMAVAIGQILFLKKFNPQRLKFDESLYNNAWISSFSKLIFPIVEEGFHGKTSFSAATGSQLGRVCAELFKTAKLISEVKK